MEVQSDLHTRFSFAVINVQMKNGHVIVCRQSREFVFACEGLSRFHGECVYICVRVCVCMCVCSCVCICVCLSAGVRVFVPARSRVHVLITSMYRPI